jgi:hypothetical protein
VTTGDETDDSDARDGTSPRVNITGTDVRSATTLSIDAANRTTRQLPASVADLNMDYGGGSDFTMWIRYYRANPRSSVANYTIGPASAPLQYVEVGHSFSNADVSGVQFDVRVNRSRLRALGATPEDVSIARYNDGEWTALSRTILRRNATQVVYRVETPGFSLFAVVVPQPAIDVESVTTHPSTVAEGESVTIATTLRNRGRLAGNTTVTFQRGDTEVTTRSVRVAAGETASVSITRTFDEPGTYTFGVGDRTATIVVEAASSPATEGPGTDAPATERPGTDAPATDGPGTDAPATDAPGTEPPAPEAVGTRADDDGSGGPGLELIGAIALLLIGLLVFVVVRRQRNRE